MDSPPEELRPGSAGPTNQVLVQAIVDFCELVSAGSSVRLTLQLEAGSEDSRTTHTPGNLFLQRGDCWDITFGKTSVHLNDSVGVRYLAILVDSQDDVAVTDLVQRAQGPQTTTSYVPPNRMDLVDNTTLLSIKSRAREIQTELADAKEFGQEAEEERLLGELEGLEANLSAVQGQRGRSRAFGDGGDRLSRAVYASVRRTLRKINDEAPQLAAHLRQTISIGRYCRYTPSDETVWRVAMSAPTRGH